MRPPPRRRRRRRADEDSDREEAFRTSNPWRAPRRRPRRASSTALRRPAAGTPRLVDRPFPPPPGVAAPRIADDGSGPLDLGLEPPRKAKKASKGGSEEYTLKEAMRLTVSAKPWNDEEDQKLIAAVTRLGSADKEGLEKALKRSWGSIAARITKMQGKGSLPEGTIAPAAGKASAAQKAAAPAPTATPAARPRPSRASSSSAGARGPPASLKLEPGPDGLLRLSAGDVDLRLWPGAAASGWYVAERRPGGSNIGEWQYVSPTGETYKNRAEVFKTGAPGAMPAATVAAKPSAGGGKEKAAPAGGKDKGGGGNRGRGKAGKAAAAEAADKPATGNGGLPPAVKLTKAQARALKGKLIEIYWDGEQEWFEAEVLAFDETAGVHFVRYIADSYECEENLFGGTDASRWRHAAKAGKAAAAEATAPEKLAPGSGGLPPAVKLTKAQARALKGKLIEIYWDGEQEWFEAEVLAFDETAGVHFVRYIADSYECEENLFGGTDASRWRHAAKTVAKGAAKAKAASSPAKGDTNAVGDAS